MKTLEYLGTLESTKKPSEDFEKPSEESEKPSEYSKESKEPKKPKELTRYMYLEGIKSFKVLNFKLQEETGKYVLQGEKTAYKQLKTYTLEYILKHYDSSKEHAMITHYKNAETIIKEKIHSAKRKEREALRELEKLKKNTEIDNLRKKHPEMFI